MDFRTAFNIVYGRQPTMSEFSANMYDQGASIIAQANQIVADRTSVVETPPAVVETPPAVVETPPAVVETPPAVVETPPAVVETPPAVVETPPAVELQNQQAGVASLPKGSEQGTDNMATKTIKNVTSVPGGYRVEEFLPDLSNPYSGAGKFTEYFVPAEDVVSSSQTFRNFGMQTDIQLPDDYTFGAIYTPPVTGFGLNEPAKVTNINTGESAPIDQASEVINTVAPPTGGGDAGEGDAVIGDAGDKDQVIVDESSNVNKKEDTGVSSLPTTPTGEVPIDTGLRQVFDQVVKRPPKAEDMTFYTEKYGPDLDFQERAELTRALRPEQLEFFDRQLGLPSTVRRDAAGNIPTVDPLDFSSFGATPATAGIARLKPTDTTGTMAGVFASPQFTSPYSIQTEQQQLPDTFTQLGDLFSEQFKEEIRGPLEEQIRAEVAEEAAGNRAGGLASLGYRRGGVVDENGIPRLFIGGLFKGIGRALSGAVKGITKIAPFVLPFIPGFQALSLPMQSLIAGGVGGFRDGKFDLKRALTSGLTTYGIGRLAQSAGASVTPESGGVGGGVSDAAVAVGRNPSEIVGSAVIDSGQAQAIGAATPGVYNFGTPIDPTATGNLTSSFTGPVSTSSGVGLDSLKGQVVGTGQNILKTGQELLSGNIPMKELTTPALTTIGGITATKAGDEIAKQQAEYKALTAADAAEKERKRRLALEAMKRNPFGYNEGGVSSLPARYLDGAGDGMSDSIRANIGGMQEARLADGEFVVPADVVADLGNGSSNAGAERLYSMMDRIRQARHGTTKQPPEVNVNKALPA